MVSELPGILIVDDNDDNRYTLQLLLETDGHERIASASGGNEAIALLDKQKFSLVLLDMMMPDMNGDEVLRIIKGNPDTRDIPVVMISADSDTEKVSKCIELGADDYLPKPFNPTVLRARIGSALRQGSLRALQSEYVRKMEQGKKDSDSLLRNLFPPEIVARLRNGDSNIADHFEDATVIFADVVGFGKITSQMKAFEIVGCLNHLFSERERIRSWLESQQWQLSEAENGRVALDRLADDVPDIILLDLMMPEMDGFQLITALQEQPAWRDIPVIVITALDLTAADRARLNSGVEGILLKGSFDPAQLVATVRSHVATTRRSQKVSEVAS